MNKIKKFFKKDIIKYDGSFLEEYYKTVKLLVHNNTFMIIVIASAFLTYGFYMYFHAIGVDDLDTNRFFVDYGLISQGRFVGQILHEIFGIMDKHMFFTMAITVGLFILAAIYTTALLKMLSGIKSFIVLAIFASLMISFPTNAFIFDFILASVMTSLGYLLSIFAAVYTIEYCISKKTKHLLLVILLTIISISSYESFVFVYFMIMLFVFLFSNTKKLKLNVKSALNLLIVTSLVIIIATVIESIIANGIINILGVEKTDRVALTETLWFTTTNLTYTFKRLFFNIFINYYFIGLLDFSHFYFIIVTVLMFIAVFILSDKKTRWINLLFAIMINFTIFGISFVDGAAQIPRTAQTLATFVMFGSAYIYLMLDKKIIKRIFIIVMSFAIYSSAHLQNTYYEREWNNHVQQENFINTVMHDIESEYGVGQDIYFVGRYKYYNYEKWYNDSTLRIYKDTLPGKIFAPLNERFYNGSLTNEDYDYYGFAFYSSSVLVDVFGGYGENEYKQEYLLKYATYLGYDAETCDIDILTDEEEADIFEDMNNYPQKGYIKEKEGCIYVNIAAYDEDDEYRYKEYK